MRSKPASLGCRIRTFDRPAHNTADIDGPDKIGRRGRGAVQILYRDFGTASASEQGEKEGEKD